MCVCVCVPPRGRCSHAGPQGRLAFVCLGMLPVSLHMGPFWESRYGSGGGPCDSALGGRWTLHTVSFCALELIHRERASLCPACVCVRDAPVCMHQGGCPHVLGCLDPWAPSTHMYPWEGGIPVSPHGWGECCQACKCLQVPHNLSLFWYTGISAVD